MSKLRRITDGGLMFHCPGCGDDHVVSDGWQWNGDFERPTLSPSVLVRTGHYLPGYSGDSCWCTYNAEHPDEPAPFSCYRCHFFVREGRIEFLSDSTHALAGQTVGLPDLHPEAAAA